MISGGFTLGTLAQLGLCTTYDHATLIMDADGEEIALKYYPITTSPITDLDIYFAVTGTVTGINFKFRVESDNNDTPSGSLLGSATAEFAGPSSSNWNGLKTLSSDTGNLSLNVPVWLIVYRSSGSSLSGTNKIATRGLTSSLGVSYSIRGKLYSGSWVSVVSDREAFVVKHSNGEYGGLPIHNQLSTPVAATHIYSDYYHGLKFRYPVHFNLYGFTWRHLKTGSPNALVARVYIGDSYKTSVTIPAASIVSTLFTQIYFSSPVLIPANNTAYIVLGQESDGGNDSNDYSSYTGVTSSTYLPYFLPSTFRFVYGDWSASGSVPSGLTEATAEIPYIIPFGYDSDTDLSMDGGPSRIFSPVMGGYGVSMI